MSVLEPMRRATVLTQHLVGKVATLLHDIYAEWDAATRACNPFTELAAVQELGFDTSLPFLAKHPIR
jgi:hypothetical protein